ncbi:PIN domain-containing protein [Leptolyngbya sp. DQ-M1]|uniref:PIN domain-containing protein n=1 Tax=Leptolyngbya sp. DQ-M1 TaxID=2933920 RepID=UPI0032986EB0
MNIYVETNFILELAFEQEQCTSYESVLSLCQTGQAGLIIPAYSLAEPHEKLSRQAIRRTNLQQQLNAELAQLSRTVSYGDRIRNIQDVSDLITLSNQEERQRFNQIRSRLISLAEIIPLTSDILLEAASCELTYQLRPQDAIVYASVVDHLQQNQPQRSCFLNRNARDFDDPNIIGELNQLNCRMLSRFDHGYQFIQAQLRSS